VLAGDRDWTVEGARVVAAALTPATGWRTHCLTDRELLPGSLPLDAGTRLIGTECDLLIVDTWSGMDPDGLGAASGTLKGGGLLVLLTPPLADWPKLADPQAGRIAVWPERAETCTGRFVSRLARVLARCTGVTAVRQGSEPPRLALLPPHPGAAEPQTQAETTDPSEPATGDQRLAVAAILRLARGRAHRPLVLTAHRGRGKSAALGIAAARLVQRGLTRILVTAPRRAACESLFRHAALAWPGSVPEGGGLAAGGAQIRFLSPDALRETHPEADLLLVDEAAGIPAHLLADLLALYPRSVFATTVHGYEGTGRGFEVRFRATLDRLTPDWRPLALDAPIRWASSDPLEALIFRALLLDASPVPAEDIAQAEPGACDFERLDRAALANDEATLSQVFGLLVLAHYQTKPLDLRMLLDGPNIRVYALRFGQPVVATVLAAEEGGMDNAGLRDAIYEGWRRPRGHLLPQTLSAHAGLADAPRLRYLRVVRIAVHPALARRGLGRLMLRCLFKEARRDGFDLLGASFGATPELIAFWDACGYRPAQLGTSRNAASGEHALAVLRRSSREGAALARQAERRLESRLPALLPGPLRRLDPRVAAALIGMLRVPPPGPAWPPPDEAIEVDSFVTGNRTLEAALPVLAELCRRRLGAALRSGRIDPEGAGLLIAATRQLRPAGELAEAFGDSGRATLIQRLRRLAGLLLG
jgi:tRNA(Met) cytidine acetyltransferase